MLKIHGSEVLAAQSTMGAAEQTYKGLGSKANFSYSVLRSSSRLNKNDCGHHHTWLMICMPGVSGIGITQLATQLEGALNSIKYSTANHGICRQNLASAPVPAPAPILLRSASAPARPHPLAPRMLRRPGNRHPTFTRQHHRPTPAEMFQCHA
jgi:hypothetical protein